MRLWGLKEGKLWRRGGDKQMMRRGTGRQSVPPPRLCVACLKGVRGGTVLVYSMMGARARAGCVCQSISCSESVNE